MSVQLERSVKRFRGLSTDLKPGRDKTEPNEDVFPTVGSIFVETDTGKRYVWRGSWPWVRQEQTIEDNLERLIEVNSQILATLAATQRGHEEYSWGNEAPTE